MVRTSGKPERGRGLSFILGAVSDDTQCEVSAWVMAPEQKDPGAVDA